MKNCYFLIIRKILHVTLLVLAFWSKPTFAQIVQRGNATSGTTTNAILNIPKPAGIIAGDILIANICQAYSNDNPSSSGWTLITGENQGNYRYSSIMYKVATGSEGNSITFTLGSGTNAAVGSIIAFSGVDSQNPFDVNNTTLNTSSGTTATANSITTATNNAAIIFLGGSFNTSWSSWSGTNPDFTEIMEFSNSNNVSVAAAWGIKTTAGSTGSRTVALADNSYYGVMMLALKPLVSPVTYTSSGSFIVPDGVYQLTVECWGGGGAGGGSTSNNYGGSGGGGGGYSKGQVNVTPGQVINFNVGTGGTGSTSNGTAGGTTSFLTLTANGGNGGGSNSGAVGTGGTATGGSISNITGSNGTSGGSIGGNGGTGAAGGTGGTGGTNANGTAGNPPGGGGGGGERGGGNSRSGGAGADGQVLISWVVCQPPTAYIVSGGGAYCSGESGVTINLSGSETGVTYELYKDGTTTGTTQTGTGSALSFTNVTVAGTYTIVGTRNSGKCTTNMTGSAVVSAIILPTPGNTLSTANPACANTPFTLSVQNPGTNVSYQWQTSANGSSWSDITSNSLTLINTDFSSQPANTNTFGANTSVTGGELVLTTTAGGYIGGFVIQNTPGSNINAFTASFDYRIWDGTGADGMSLSYAPNIANTTGGGEEGEGSGLILKFDTYDNISGQGSASQIRINYNNTLVWSNTLKNFDLRNSAYRSVNLSVNDNGYLSLSIGSTSIVTGLLLPGYIAADKSAWKFKFSGRTGGSTDKHSIDNLNITYGGNLPTNSTYTTSLTSTTYFRCKIYCGTNTVYSNPVQVVVNVPTYTAAPSSTTCAGTDVTYTTQSGQSNYTWTTSNADYTITSGSLGTTSSSVTLKWLNAGSRTVSVTYTSSGGCSGLPPASAVTTVNARPSAVITSTNTSICSGSSATISGTVTASGAWTLNLSNGTGTVTGNGNGTFNKVVSPATTTTYTISSLTDANCTSIAADLTGSTQVTVNPLPATVIVSGGGTFCGNTTITAANGGDGTIYFQGTTSGGTSTTTPSASQIITTSGTYYFRARSAAGCWGTEGSTTVTINTVPDAVTVSGGGTYCGSALLTASGGTGGTIYFQGTTSGGTSISTPAGSQSVSASGTYYFRARSAQGCWGQEGSTTVIINPSPSTPVIGTITQPTCTIGTGSIALSGLPSSGNWTLTRQPGNVTTTGTGTTTTITGLNPGTYSFTVANEDLGGNCPGSGDGLKAEYFNNMALSGTASMTRTDATIDFNWGNGGPGSPINNDNFSVRWSGKVQACYSQTYTFYTQSDDGIRLWVDGTQVINNWTDHGSTTNTGTIYLTAGQKYDIVLEFYENGGQALAQLSWSCASQAQQIIPQSQLYSSTTPGCTSPASANAVINAQPVTPSAPAISFPTNTTPVCLGSSINLSAVSSGNTIYWYTVPTGGATIGQSASGSNFAVAPSANTTYYAEARTPDGCISSSRSATALVTVSSLSAAATSISGTTTICAGNSTTLTVTGGSLGSGASWKWYSGSCAGTLVGTGTSITVSPTSTTNYFVRAEGDCNVTGCATTSVTVNPKIVTNFIQPE